jgi:hypothetical protein
LPPDPTVEAAPEPAPPEAAAEPYIDSLSPVDDDLLPNRRR